MSDEIPVNATRDWTLGAIGWIFSHKPGTSDSRQIAVTEIAEGSPSDGVLEVGDVILGVAGETFAHDLRVEFGRALTTAETGGGKSSEAESPVFGIDFFAKCRENPPTGTEGWILATPRIS